MVQPAIPVGRRHRSLALPGINDPAPLATEGRIDLAATRAVIDVAELVLADDLAVPPRIVPVLRVAPFHQVKKSISQRIWDVLGAGLWRPGRRGGI